jgi:hypothetical protein
MVTFVFVVVVSAEELTKGASQVGDIIAPNPVRPAQKDGRGVTLKLKSGLLRLEVCGERTFHIVWIAVGHGVGINPTGQPDAVVAYKGETVKVSRSKP